MLSLLQYGLDLWEARNNHVHGETPENQRFITRRKVIQRARDLYQEREMTVPAPQRRLFRNFENRLDGRTRAIECWIEMVELAQSKRKEELKELAKQPKIHKFFQRTPSSNQTANDLAGSVDPVMGGTW